VPARISPEVWKRFDALLADGWNVTAASREVGIDRATGSRRARGVKKRDGKILAKLADEVELPDVKTHHRLSNDARRALEDFAFFRLLVLGRTSVPWQVKAAEDVVRLLESPDKEYVVINVPPGAGKSTLFTHDIPLWLICRNRSIRILIGSLTERQAKMYTGRLRDSLERTRPYLATDMEKSAGAVDAQKTVTDLFGRFKPTNPKVWRVEEFTVAQPNDDAAGDKENTVAAYGKDGGVLGTRVDFVIWDDLIDNKNQRTVEAREELKQWWKSTAETRLEPRGLLVLQGQRMGSDDLYRFALDMKDIVLDDDGNEDLEAERPRKYKHIIYKAHYEELCEGRHPKGTSAWPEGCLLDPYRLPWRELARTKANGVDSFLVQYQQEDTDPANVLVQKLWITGGRDEHGITYPGCWDEDRSVGELPRGLTGQITSYATADPSPTMFWSVQWWALHHDSGQFFLLDHVRRKMRAPELLDWDNGNQQFVGLMEEWQARSYDLGHPITHWIVEDNAAQRFLLQFEHVRRWQTKHAPLSGVQVVAHQTHRNKSDAKYGVQSLGPLYRSGAIRLPGRQRDGSRVASLKLVDEVTKWPEGSTDDCVMAQWFGVWNAPNLFNGGASNVYQFPVPRWMRAAV
jgi:hypothetical protein